MMYSLQNTDKKQKNVHFFCPLCPLFLSTLPIWLSLGQSGHGPPPTILSGSRGADWSLDIHVSTWLVVVRIWRIGYWYNTRLVGIGQIASVHLLTIIAWVGSWHPIRWHPCRWWGLYTRSSMLWSIALRLYFRNKFISAFSGNSLSLWSPKVFLATLKDRSLATDDGGGHKILPY